MESKYGEWEIVFQHPLAGGLTWRKCEPTEITVFTPRGYTFDVIYHLTWRDMENKIAYYTISNFLKEFKK